MTGWESSISSASWSLVIEIYKKSRVLKCFCLTIVAWPELPLHVKLDRYQHVTLAPKCGATVLQGTGTL